MKVSEEDFARCYAAFKACDGGWEPSLRAALAVLPETIDGAALARAYWGAGCTPEDVRHMRRALQEASAARPERPEPVACARCGELEREHHYNGACYGKCGAYVDPRQPANAPERPQSLQEVWAVLELHERMLRALRNAVAMTPILKRDLDPVLHALDAIEARKAGGG